MTGRYRPGKSPGPRPDTARPAKNTNPQKNIPGRINDRRRSLILSLRISHLARTSNRRNETTRARERKNTFLSLLRARGKSCYSPRFFSADEYVGERPYEIRPGAIIKDRAIGFAICPRGSTLRVDVKE